MTFNSFQFLAFFLIVWPLIAFATTHRVLSRLWPGKLTRSAALCARNCVLIAAGYVFYGAWDPRFLLLLCGSTVVDFYCARWMARTADLARRKRILLISLGANLGTLAIFKYANFFAASLTELLARVGVEASPFVLNVVLPVGVSFYTFQALSYTIDVYRGLIKAETSLIRFAAFVAFFPPLVAGPIERGRHLLPQFRRLRPITWLKIDRGVYLIVVGLFKKVVIADTVAQVANAAFALQEPTGIQSLLGVYAFAIQIYCDFSGYTDIARGVAQLLGFQLSDNFNLPYFSATPSEFWQRWHISLSSWLRDYLYIPLGGNRGGPLLTYRNLMLTMLLGGLWHGAAWTFVLWGAFHGALLCVYRALTPWVAPLLPKQGVLRALTSFVGVIVFFQLTCLGWLLFRAQSMAQVRHMLGSLSRGPWHDLAKQVAALGPVPWSVALSCGLLLVQLLSFVKKDIWMYWKLPSPVRAVCYATCVILVILAGQDGAEPFIYFQF
jgi:D-alanyl-lipoteichoic acid acyltransferase DltB (MBOAT superfamily)